MLPVLFEQGEEDAGYEPDQSEAEDVCGGVAADAGVACGEGGTEVAEEFSVIHHMEKVNPTTKMILK